MILSAAPAPERSTVRGRLRKRAQERSVKSPEMRHFRGTASTATSRSRDSFRSRSIRIAIVQRPSRSQANPSAKSVKKVFRFLVSASADRGVFWPKSQKMKIGGLFSNGLELISRPHMRLTAHDARVPTTLGTSARFLTVLSPRPPLCVNAYPSRLRMDRARKPVTVHAYGIARTTVLGNSDGPSPRYEDPALLTLPAFLLR